MNRKMELIRLELKQYKHLLEMPSEVLSSSWVNPISMYTLIEAKQKLPYFIRVKIRFSPKHRQFNLHT
jgi:hypothetical protein